MKFRITAMIAACVMAAGALAGCGDSGSGGGSTKKSGGAVGEGGGNKTEKGAKQAVEDFYDCYLTKNSAEDYYALMFPSDLMKKYKKENPDDYDDYMDEFNEDVEDSLDIYKSISIDFTDVDEIDDDFLDGAIYYYMNKASYFGIDRDDVDIDVSKGYEIKFKLEVEDKDGDTETRKKVCCVVWIDGDGWKILDGYEEEDLEDYAEYYKEYKEEEKDDKDDKFDD